MGRGPMRGINSLSHSIVSWYNPIVCFKKKKTSIIKHNYIKIQVKNSYLKIKIKIKIKGLKFKLVSQYLHYIHYSDRTLIEIVSYSSGINMCY